MPRKRPDPGGRLQERGGIYVAYQTPSTPFSAPSAVNRHKSKNRRFSKHTRQRLDRKIRSFRKVVSKKESGFYGPLSSPSTTLLHSAAAFGQKPRNRRIRSTNRNLEVLANPVFPVGLSRRRAASICRFRFRQRPFCTPLTVEAVRTANLPFWRKTLPC